MCEGCPQGSMGEVRQYLLLHLVCRPHSVQARRDLRAVPPGEPYGESTYTLGP